MRPIAVGRTDRVFLSSVIPASEHSSAVRARDNPNNCNGVDWDDKRHWFVSKVFARPHINFHQEVAPMCEDEDDPVNFSLPAGDRSLAGAVMQGRDLICAQLAHVDLTAADLYWGLLYRCVLEGAILRGCCLRGASMREANLRGADLRSADLSLSNLGGPTDLEGADLTGADLRNAKIGGALFVRAILVDADLRDARARSILPKIPTRFDGADLTGARLGGVDLTGCIYDEGTRFPRAFDLSKAGMVHASEIGGPRKKRSKRNK